MKKYIILLLFFIIPDIVLAEIVPSQGVAVIENNNIIYAKNNALDDAFNKAVLEVLNRILPENYRDNKTIIDKICSNSIKYIKEYKIIKEYSSENIYYINIESKVLEKNIYNGIIDLGLVKGDIVTIEITINNLYKYSYFSEILNIIKEMIMVKDLRYKSFRKGSATIEVNIIGDMEKFIEWLKSLKFNGFNIYINQKGNNIIFNISSS